MSILSKPMNGIGGEPKDDDDDYFLDDDYDDNEDLDGDDEARPGIFSKKGSGDKTSSKGGFLGRKVVSIDEARGDMEVTMIKPQGMDDSREICDYLLAGKAVVLNMEGMNMDVAQRIIDFTLGAIYSIDGDFQPISKYIFMASPRNVELSGDFNGDFQNMLTEKVVKQQNFGGFGYNG